MEDIYQITIAILMHFIFIFNIFKAIKKSIKLVLFCQKAQKKFDLEYYKSYINDTKETNKSKLENKSFIDIIYL